MNGADHRSWQAVIGSSAILSLALLGDALIYAVLPVYAEDFGLTMPWVGVLLSANRFVRVFAYGVIARMATTIGVRRMCIAGAVLATVSTALYGFGQGPEVLIIARIMWGLAYAVLLLVTLFYSVEYRDQVGIRVGVSRAIQRLGPIAALFIGSWFVGLVGPNTAFIILAVPTALASPLHLLCQNVNRRKRKLKNHYHLHDLGRSICCFSCKGMGLTAFSLSASR